MSFLLTTIVYFIIGVISSLLVRVLYNKGPSTNLLHVTLVITTVVCCWMVWAIVFIAQTNPLIVPVLQAEE